MRSVSVSYQYPWNFIDCRLHHSPAGTSPTQLRTVRPHCIARLNGGRTSPGLPGHFKCSVADGCVLLGVILLAPTMQQPLEHLTSYLFIVFEVNVLVIQPWISER